MDIRQLRYFIGVLEAKSITRAAETLHVAQPAIGMQIRNLEDELGVKLLERHSRGVTPTEAGQELAARAEGLIRELDQTRQDVMEIGGVPRGRISLGMTKTVVHVLAADLVEVCRQKYPAVTLNVIEGMSWRLTDSMAESGLDAVLTFYPSREPNVEVEALATEDMHLIMRPDHPLAEHAEIDLRQVLPHDVIVSPRVEPYFRLPLENIAKEVGVEVRIACETDSVTSMIEFTCRGLGCSVMPWGLVADRVADRRLVARRIVAPLIERTLYLLYSKKRLSSKALEVVRDEIRWIVGKSVEAGTKGWAPLHGKPARTPDSNMVVGPQSRGNK